MAMRGRPDSPTTVARWNSETCTPHDQLLNTFCNSCYVVRSVITRMITDWIGVHSVLLPLPSVSWLEIQKRTNARGCSTVADRVQLGPHVNLVSIVPWEERRGEEVKWLLIHKFSKSVARERINKHWKLMNKGGKFLKELWCCVGGRVNLVLKTELKTLN